MTHLPNPYTVTTLSIEEAAPFYGIGRGAAYVATGDGRIPSIKVGGRRRIPVAAIYAALGLPLPPPPAPEPGPLVDVGAEYLAATPDHSRAQENVAHAFAIVERQHEAEVFP